MSDIDRKGNTGEGIHYKVEKTHFDILETLPPQIRKALANAPYPISVTEIAVFLMKLDGAGVGKVEAAQMLLEKFNAMIVGLMRSEVNRLYGAEHPQAEVTKWEPNRRSVVLRRHLRSSRTTRPVPAGRMKKSGLTK